MTERRILSRDQLAQFLSNQETIRAFEKLFEQANVTLPDIVVEAAETVESTRPNNFSAVERQQRDQEAQAPSRPLNLDGIYRRLDELEQRAPRPDSMLQEIDRRLQELEGQVPGRDINVDAIIKRLETIEALIGV
jgi:hypothetical protein